MNAADPLLRDRVLVPDSLPSYRCWLIIISSGTIDGGRCKPMELSAVLAVALARNAVFSSLSTIRFLESMSQARLAAIVAVDLKVIQVPNLGFQTGLLDYFTGLQKKERKKKTNNGNFVLLFHKLMIIVDSFYSIMQFLTALRLGTLWVGFSRSSSCLSGFICADRSGRYRLLNCNRN